MPSSSNRASSGSRPTTSRRDWRAPLLYGGGMLDRHAQAGNDRERLQLMFEKAPGFMALVEGSDLQFAIANKAFQKLVGRSDLIGKGLTEAFPELDEQGIDDILKGVGRSGEPFVAHALPLTVVREDLTPEELVLDLVFQPVPGGVFIQGHDVTDQKRGEMLRTAHSKVLALAISDSPLEQTLSELIRIVETNSSTGVLGSILLLDADGKHLHHGAAPSLPREYSAAID